MNYLQKFLIDKRKGLTDKENLEMKIYEFIKDLMENSEGLTLSGEPVSKEAVDMIIDSLSYGLRTAKVINKKITQ